MGLKQAFTQVGICCGEQRDYREGWLLLTVEIETNGDLKVPKREIFVTELFILSDPIWVGDLRTEPKKPFV